MSPTFRCVLATVGCCAGACEPRSRANMANNAGIASLIFTLPQPRHSSLPPAHYTPVPPLANSFRLNAGPPASAQAPSKDKVQSLAQLSHKRFPADQVPPLSLGGAALAVRWVKEAARNGVTLRPCWSAYTRPASR